VGDGLGVVSLNDKRWPLRGRGRGRRGIRARRDGRAEVDGDGRACGNRRACACGERRRGRYGGRGARAAGRAEEGDRCGREGTFQDAYRHWAAGYGNRRCGGSPGRRSRRPEDDYFGSIPVLGEIARRCGSRSSR
jgi:hypothetical protein